MDFASYNPHIDLVTYLEFDFIFTDGGSVDASFLIDSFRFSLYFNTRSDNIRFVFEIIFYFLFLYFLIREILEIKAKYNIKTQNQENKDN